MTAQASGYIAISRRPLDLEDYIDVARRHVAWIAGPLFLGLVASIVVALLLPNSYRSEAVMQITPAQISEDLVKNTGNSLLTDRIIQMESNIMSRTSLSNLIQSPTLNLYPSERLKQPLEDVIEALKKDLRITIDSAPGVSKHASAFKISFSYTNRFKAQLTVQSLITRFMDENQNSQHAQQTLLHDFFGDELAGAKANLEKANEEMTKFKTENQGRLPEQTQLNMAAMQSYQNSLNVVQDQLNRLGQERIQLEAHLSTLKSQMDLVGMMSQESSAAALPGSPALRQNVELEQLNKQIDANETQLQQFLQVYRETYPDIRDVRKRLSVLKKQRDDLQAKQDATVAADAAKPKDAPRKGTNFQVAQSQTMLQGEIDKTNGQLKSNDSERAYKLKDQENINRQIEDYRNKLAATSGIESRYLDLQRDQANAAQKFQVMLQKQELTAQQSDLISRKAGEALDVLDPPSLPVNPSSPNRWLIVGGGLAASFMLGLALAGVQEAKDTSLKNLKDVRAYTNLPVLCSIPLLENTLLVKRKKRITYLAWSAAVICGIIAVCIAVFYYLSAAASGQ